MSGAVNENWRQRMRQLEEQLTTLERSTTPEVQDQVRQIVQTLMALHGAGLAQVTKRLADGGETGQAILQACARDELAGTLLLLHGLHPWDLDTRLRWALSQLRPQLLAEGSSVFLISAKDGVVRLGVASAPGEERTVSTRLRSLLQKALLAVAPEVAVVDVEARAAPPSTLIPLPLVGEARPAATAGPRQQPEVAR
jgi:hypothetical protein